jgi:hypothetical protein
MIDFKKHVGNHLVLLAKINKVFDNGYVELLFAGSTILCHKELLNEEYFIASLAAKTLITEP